jgi:glycosyltransferase involved in cell wall biosynthesis
MLKITLVSHTDTLTGAPKLLMDLADLLVENGFLVTFIVKNATKSGLLSLRKQPFKVLFLRTYQSTISGRFREIIRRKYALNQFKKQLKQSDLVINNTIDNADLLPFYNQYAKGKIISYLHELDGVIETHLPTIAAKKQLVDATKHFIVPSIFIKKRLMSKLNIDDEKVSVLNSKIPPLSTLSPNHGLKLEKPKNEFWVGMCGTADMRKGVDVFVKIAAYLKLNHEGLNIQLVWLGFEGESAKMAEEDIRKLGLQDKIRLLPRTLYPDAFFETIDIFALTSREDPYPLVVLSAANAAKPIICFEQSGGIIDFVADDCGLSVPYLDVPTFCEKIVWLYNHPSIRQQLGLNAQKKVGEWHQTDILILEQLAAIFEKISPVKRKIGTKQLRTEGVNFF